MLALVSSVLTLFLTKYAIPFTIINIGFTIFTPKNDKVGEFMLFSFLVDCDFLLEQLIADIALLITVT